MREALCPKRLVEDVVAMADFTAAYVRRALEPRLHGHGVIEVRHSLDGYTILHRYISEWNGKQISMPIAQLRHAGRKLRLFWQRSNGRWCAYKVTGDDPFVGILGECLKEIDRDTWGCFWG